MPSYMFLIYGDESRMGESTPEEWAEMLKAHQAWGDMVMSSGAKITGGAPLESSTTATSIRRGGDGPIVTDGPFAETKEALGGYYVVECSDLDAALALARDLPAEGVEVRPIIDLPE
ncbi:MAG: YciI family protein [Actinomycetes bacterium]